MLIPRYELFWRYVAHWAREDPDGSAFRFGERSVSYEELDRETDRAAESFIGLGVARGDRIATVLPICPEYVYVLIAALKVGAITVPLDVRFRSADLKRFLSMAEPKVLVAGADVELPSGLSGMTCFEREGLEDLLAGNPGAALEDRKDGQSSDDGAVIIFTGGTTGVPKAALLSQRNVAAMSYVEAETIHGFLASLGAPPRPKTLSYLPPSHVGGTLELLTSPMAAGSELVLMDRWSPYPVLETVSREKIPYLGAAPTMYAILLSLPDLDQFDLSALKLVFVSGERLSIELLEGIRDRICPNIVNGYGSTEGGSEVTFTEPGDDLKRLAEGYVGKPLPGVELRIAEDGEVLVRGPLTIPGYFRMPEEDVAGFTEDGFCRTGDLGTLSEDGGLVIHGRKKHIIRVGSYTVLPAEVEEVVSRHPDVATSVAIGVPHPIYGEVVWLVAAPREDTKLDGDELLEICQEELADFKVPKRILVRDTLPMSRVGKVDRAQIQEEVLAMKTSAEDVRKWYEERPLSSEWLTVDQALIDKFSEATLDPDWIHIDPERAKRDSPYGGTIAFGFWTLSMLTYFLRHTAGRDYPEGALYGLNYGLDRVRLMAPVRVGKRIRNDAKIVDVTERGEGRYLVKTENTVEIEGEEKPAMVAEWLFMLVYPR